MPSDSSNSPYPDALAASGRVLALAICLAITGCQTTGSQAPTHQSAVPKRPVPQVQETLWLTDREPAPATHTNIWDRVRQGYKLQDHLDSNPRIEQQRLLFSARANSIEMASERGSPYIHYIVEQLEERDMPLELALLPIIESAYNPFAYSPAQAVGLWQFIPSTGRHFNLQQTSWYDGRRDITASTAAALRYLTYLHGLFNDDWLLALAAYNAGEGTVSRAIERNQKLGLPTDYWNLPLPRETQDYVPKLLALSQMVQTPEAYGLDLSPIANEPYFEVVALKQRMDLARVAEMAELDENEIYQLNPAFTRRITLDGPQHLLVPSAKAEMFAANLALMKPQDLVNWQQYKVRPGDTLGAIANRHNLSVNIIRDLNRLRGDSLQIGQVLSLPQPAGTKQSSELLHAVARSQPAPRAYRVRKGDSLWDIAKSQKVSVHDLQRWNNLSGSSLKVGQALFLQAAGSTQQAKPAPTYYKVKKGDSLYEIAKRFNVQVNNLKTWNPRDSQRLKPGQTLTLYIPR
ncbi:lytic transglycosylase domain-containing protein [Stutzerimonas zhaodongensis]|uniref:lytic transglycosylase domain-containing protein n=1 Tax=Stutzerimonas zhaodongensis TaxID=1176257 RepID=UPI00210459D1|nr:lytic transglycosylase domain-containing protein [Stutzerimonas zhaodongensis]MCQ2028866.1 LysM peptidoglycan-binding domain-containing protein [Stutzerimonas zhaodongensis]